MTIMRLKKLMLLQKTFYHENMGVYDIGDEPEEIFDSILEKK